MALTVVFLFSIIISVFVTIYTRRLAVKNKIGSVPDSRRIHAGFIPSLGGLGIVTGMLAGLLISLLWYEHFWVNVDTNYFGIALGTLVVLIAGIVDDVKGLRAHEKFVAQLIAASLMIAFGCRIQIILNPFGAPINLGLLSVPITFFWIVWVTNSINLLDGLDGLAAGVSIIVLTTFSFLSGIGIGLFPILLSVALIGGVLGFLRFNYHPAKIFMGDTGSLTLGFLIAAISIKGLQYSQGNISILIPLVILALPLGDSALAFIRRLNKGHHPFHADKDHLHHRLVYLGLSHRQAVHIIYLVSLLFALSGYILATESTIYGSVLVMLVFVIVLFGLIRLGYLEAKKNKQYLGDGALISVRRALAPISMRRFWHKLLLITGDIVAINVALLLTFWLRFISGIIHETTTLPPDYYFAPGVFMILTIYFVILFGLNGLYNISWDISRFEIVFRDLKAIFFGVLIVFIVTIEPGRWFAPSRLVLVFYMLILMFVVILIRLTIIQIEKKFSILEYAPHNTLLVGMSRNARKAIKDIRKNPHLLYDLKGYISRTPEQQALESLPYLGRYDDMPEIIRRYGIEEIIIGINERSRDEILKIVAYGENMRVAFKIVPQMYDVISGHKTKEMVDHPLIRLFPDQMRPWQWLFKRAIDILVALIGMLFLTPLISIAVIMQVSSGIYPFFVIENKIGKQGKVFGQLLLNYKDRRKGVGKFLYQTYIYKLPQVINLLLGQVSLVGPRPESPEIVEDLRKRIKFYNRRFLVRPGITGWTQVRYRYTESLKQLKEQFKQDIFYLENMSLLFDFQIMVRSIMLLIIRKI